jgi:dipeptidyl aminopeptidase/acylaminoacyl peptidase
LWDLSAGRLDRTDFAHGDTINSAVFVNGGKTVATASDDGSVLLWDAPTGKRVGRVEGTGTVGLQIAADAAGRRFAVSNENPALIIFDGETFKPTAMVKDRLVAMHMVAMSPDGSLAAAVERHATVRVIDAKTGDERCRFGINPRQFAAIPLAISPDNRLVAVGAGDPDRDKDVVRLMDAASGRETKVLPVGAGSKLNADAYGTLTWSPDGAMLAVAAWGKPIELWEVSTGQRRERITGDGDAGTCIAFSPDGRWLAAGGGPDKPTVRIWELPSCRLVAKFAGGHKDRLKRVAWSPDSSRVVSCSSDTTAYVWDVAAALKHIQPIAEVDADGGRVADAVAALGQDDAAGAWNAIKVLAARPGPAVTALAEAIKPVIDAGGAEADSQRVSALIRQLDSDTFADREAAQRELVKLGESAGPAMRQAVRSAKSDEVRTRLNVILAGLTQGGATRSADGLRAMRGIETLERIGTPEARVVLEKIARERPGSVVSSLAKLAAGRMSASGR